MKHKATEDLWQVLYAMTLRRMCTRLAIWKHDRCAWQPSQPGVTSQAIGIDFKRMTRGEAVNVTDMSENRFLEEVLG